MGRFLFRLFLFFGGSFLVWFSFQIPHVDNMWVWPFAVGAAMDIIAVFFLEGPKSPEQKAREHKQKEQEKAFWEMLMHGLEAWEAWKKFAGKEKPQEHHEPKKSSGINWWIVLIVLALLLICILLLFAQQQTGIGPGTYLN